LLLLLLPPGFAFYLLLFIVSKQLGH